MATDRSLSIDAIIKRTESINAVARKDILYRISNSMGFNEEDITTWDVPTGTADVSLAFPPGFTTADGLIIRINKKAGADDHIKVRFNDVTAPQINVEEVLVWFGTTITEIHVTNDSGSVVDVLFHMFAE